MGTPRPEERATQAAMAEEIGADLGRMRKSDAWMQRAAKVSPSAWRRYFSPGSIDRSIPFAKVQAIADVLGVRASALIARAEDNLDAHTDRLMRSVGATEQEIADLRAAIEAKRSKPE